MEDLEVWSDGVLTIYLTDVSYHAGSRYFVYRDLSVLKFDEFTTPFTITLRMLDRDNNDLVTPLTLTFASVAQDEEYDIRTWLADVPLASGKGSDDVCVLSVYADDGIVEDTQTKQLLMWISDYDYLFKDGDASLKLTSEEYMNTPKNVTYRDERNFVRVDSTLAYFNVTIAVYDSNDVHIGESIEFVGVSGAYNVDVTTWLRSLRLSANDTDVFKFITTIVDNDTLTTKTKETYYYITYGVNKDYYQTMIDKAKDYCVGGTKIKNFPLPDTIMRGEESADVLVFYTDLPSGYSVTGATYDADKKNISIASNTAKVQEVDDYNNITRTIFLKNQDPEKRYCKISGTPIFGSTKAFGIPYFVAWFELREYEVAVDVAELMSDTIGYKYELQGQDFECKIGLSNITSYDFAYYSTLIFGLRDMRIEINGIVYDCVVGEKKYKIRTAWQGVYDFEILLKFLKNY